MSAEDILDIALQHEAIYELIAVGEDISLTGSLIALLPAQEYTACRRHDKPSQRDRILVVQYPKPLRRPKRIALRRIIPGSVEDHPGPQDRMFREIAADPRGTDKPTDVTYPAADTESHLTLIAYLRPDAHGRKQHDGHHQCLFIISSIFKVIILAASENADLFDQRSEQR